MNATENQTEAAEGGYPSHDLLASGRDGAWGLGIFGDGQKSAYHDKKTGRTFDDSLKFMSADYRAGYQSEWARLTKLSEANV